MLIILQFLSIDYYFENIRKAYEHHGQEKLLHYTIQYKIYEPQNNKRD